jgi:Zn-finger nucleic acid-binding protein
MCPNCGQPLLIVEFEGVALDHCAACGGTWLDAGELELLLALAADGRPGRPGAGARGPVLAQRGTRRAGPRRCPRCRRRMPSIRLGPVPGVRVERCRAGHGLWFDAGEIRTLVAAEQSRAVPSPAQQGGTVPVAHFLAEALRHELGLTGPGGIE